MISSGALPKVALRNPPTGSCVVGGMLGRLADQPREGNQRDRGENELGGVVDDIGKVECDDERPEKERRPQKLPGPRRATLPRRRYARTRLYA